MKIYIVFQFDGDMCAHLAAFSTKEDAKGYMVKLSHDDAKKRSLTAEFPSWGVDELTLDEFKGQVG